MLHPYARVDGRFSERLGTWTRGQKAGLVCLEFQEMDPSRGFQGGIKLQVSPGVGPLAIALGAYGALPTGGAHHAAFESLFDRVMGLTVCAEDLPDQKNRVALSPLLRDRDGAPAPKMVYRVSDNSRRALDWGMDRAERILRDAGAVEIFRTPLRSQAGFHLMGTACMGSDPDHSVVDPNSRCHDVPNLYVADASIFVTSSIMNPTATAQAFALRTADAILAE